MTDYSVAAGGFSAQYAISMSTDIRSLAFINIFNWQRMLKDEKIGDFNRITVKAPNLSGKSQSG